MNKFSLVALILSGLLFLDTSVATPKNSNNSQATKKNRKKVQVTNELSEALNGDYIGQKGILNTPIADIIYKNLDNIPEAYINKFLNKINYTKEKLQEVGNDPEFKQMFKEFPNKNEIFEDTKAKLNDIFIILNNILSTKKIIVSVMAKLTSKGKYKESSQNLESDKFSDYVKNLQKMFANVIDSRASDSLVHINTKKLSSKLFKHITEKESKEKINKKTSQRLLAGYTKLQNNIPVLISHIRDISSNIKGLNTEIVTSLNMDKLYKKDLKNNFFKQNESKTPHIENAHKEIGHPLIKFNIEMKRSFKRKYQEIKTPQDLFEYIEKLTREFKSIQLDESIVINLINELEIWNSKYKKSYMSLDSTPNNRCAYIYALVDTYNMFVIDTGADLPQIGKKKKEALGEIALNYGLDRSVQSSNKKR